VDNEASRYSALPMQAHLVETQLKEGAVVSQVARGGVALYQCVIHRYMCMVVYIFYIIKSSQCCKKKAGASSTCLPIMYVEGLVRGSLEGHTKQFHVSLTDGKRS